MTKYILLNRRKSKIEKTMISLWIGCENVIFNCGKTMKNLWKPILTENQHSEKIYISYDSVDNFVNDLQKYGNH